MIFSRKAWLLTTLANGWVIHAEASPSRQHFARLFSRPGAGDQTYTLEVDGRRVYRSSDVPPGRHNERLSWDLSGTIVTLEYAGRQMFAYNTETRTQVRN